MPIELEVRLRVRPWALPQRLEIVVDGVAVEELRVEQADFAEHVIEIPGRLVRERVTAIGLRAANTQTVEARGYWREVADSPVGQGHHYNRNAETFMLTGDALGRGMLKLLNRPPEFELAIEPLVMPVVVLNTTAEPTTITLTFSNGGGLRRRIAKQLDAVAG